MTCGYSCGVPGVGDAIVGNTRRPWTPSFRTFTLVYLAVSAPWILALPAAINGVNVRWLPVAGMFASVLIGAGMNRFRERDYWNRSWSERQRIAVAVRTGQPTGVRELDSVALDRLRRASHSPRGDRVMAFVFAGLVIVVPVVAAIRTTWWWLAALAATPPLVVLLVRCGRPEDPRVRLARFRAGLPLDRLP